ncbi:MAG TPA: NfeD family protein [Chromatiales bacterium]|nr:NfeD family protein [Chromatiales bacterium]
MEWLHNLDYWHWWVLGVAFVVLEVFSPAAFFLWLGIAAGAVGVLMLIWPDLGWQYQILAFAVLSVVSVFAGRTWLKRHPIKTDEPTLNRRGMQYIGRVFTLERPIVNGYGKISVDDTTWRVIGPDAPAGAQVRVTAVQGVDLQVEPVDEGAAA